MATRRDFIRDATRIVAGTAAAGCFPDVGGQWRKQRGQCHEDAGQQAIGIQSHVVEIFDDGSVQETHDPSLSFALQADTIRDMLERALGQLTDGSQGPWQTLLPDVTKDSRVGIKVNCLNKTCATSVPFVRAIVDGLRAEMGLAKEQILVWDRTLKELSDCGFQEDLVGAAVIGTIYSSSDPSGPGYEDEYCSVVAGKTTRFSRILTELTDITINCPVLKTHDLSGVTGAMKNIYGVIANPEDFHDDLNVTLPALYDLTPIRTKMTLHLLDALVAVTTGSTSSPVDTVPKRILASKDPVALDHHALALANQLRSEKTERQLQNINTELTQWLGNAQERGQGSMQYELTRIA